MGTVYIVGIGPGDPLDMTVRADKVLESCDCIIGYPVYVELVRQRYPGKAFFTTPMAQEVRRCQMALEEGRKGRSAALVCSGDSGIYGMAALVYELRGADPTPEIHVVPGLTAACSGGALLGAPLTHDFAVISLSDRLTPWEKIETRLRLAAQADLSIVLYNPASRGRPEHLARAVRCLREVLPEGRLCGITRNIGREGETWRLCTLAQLEHTPVDMFCTVFIGNAMTKEISGHLVTPRGYRGVTA